MQGCVLHVRYEGSTPVLELHGELDLWSAPVLGDALAAALVFSDRLVVDLAHLRFADLAGLAPLVAVRQAAGRVEVRNVPPVVAKLVAVVPDVGAALLGSAAQAVG